MAISGKISSVSQIQGSISQGNELVVTRITTPGPQGETGAQGPPGSDVDLVNRSDVDSSSIANGSILQFRSSDSKFVAKNELTTSSGLDFVIDAGNF